MGLFGGGGGSSSSQLTNNSNLSNGINLSLGSFGASDSGASFTPSTTSAQTAEQKQDNGVGVSAGVALGDGTSASGGAVAQGSGASATGGGSATSLFTPTNIALAIGAYIVFKRL